MKGNERSVWDQAVDKVTTASLLLVLTKLAASWLFAALLEVPMRGRLQWGFVPYTGLETSTRQFRSIAAWSTATVVVVAICWTMWHRLRNDQPPAMQWAAALALPMSAMLAALEWTRRIDGSPVLSTPWLFRCGLALVVTSVLWVGFAPLPAEEELGDSADLVEPRKRERNSLRPSGLDTRRLGPGQLPAPPSPPSPPGSNEPAIQQTAT